MSEDDEKLIDDENLLFGQYMDEVENGSGKYFEYLGLPRDATWGHFRRHYDKDGLPDVMRAAEDLAKYPPIKARIEELKAKLDTKVVSLEDWLKKDID